MNTDKYRNDGNPKYDMSEPDEPEPDFEDLDIEYEEHQRELRLNLWYEGEY